MKSQHISILFMYVAVLFILKPTFGIADNWNGADPGIDYLVGQCQYISRDEQVDSVQPGWPKYTGYMGMSAATLADFDTTYPGTEVIVACPVFTGGLHSEIFIWHQDGNPMTNWNPLILSQSVYTGSPPALLRFQS